MYNTHAKTNENFNQDFLKNHQCVYALIIFFKCLKVITSADQTQNNNIDNNLIDS